MKPRSNGSDPSADQTHSNVRRGLTPVNVAMLRCRANSMPDARASRLTTAKERRRRAMLADWRKRRAANETTFK
ncbi:MAG: hypothetical protein ACKN9S_15055 [Pirellula sp.]